MPVGWLILRTCSLLSQAAHWKLLEALGRQGQPQTTSELPPPSSGLQVLVVSHQVSQETLSWQICFALLKLPLALDKIKEGIYQESTVIHFFLNTDLPHDTVQITVVPTYQNQPFLIKSNTWDILDCAYLKTSFCILEIFYVVCLLFTPFLVHHLVSL